MDEAGSSEASDRAANAGDGADLSDLFLLRGGKAAAVVAGGADTPESLANGSKYRILITWHLNGEIRFADASPHLLLVGKSDSQPQDPALESHNSFLDQAFPSPIPRLTISTHSVLKNASMRGNSQFDRFRAKPSRPIKVVDCQLALEVLELGIVLSTGQALHYRFGFARFSETSLVSEEVAREVEHDEAMAEQAALASPLSPTFSSHHRTPTSDLDNTISNAMDDLQIERGSQTPRTSTPTGSNNNLSPRISGGSPAGPPPPRPRRDPKRISRLGVGSSGGDRSPSYATSPEITRSPTVAPAPSTNSHPGEQIIELSHLASWKTDGFKPNCFIDLQRGEISSFAISDVGFLSLASGGGLAIVDLRGPEFLVKDGFGESLDSTTTSDSKEARRMAELEAESNSSIVKLNFSICRTAEDPSLALRLLVTREKFLTVWTITRSLDIWLAERSSAREMSDLVLPKCNLIVDLAGNPCLASPAELQRCFREQHRNVEPNEVPMLDILLAVSSQGKFGRK